MNEERYARRLIADLDDSLKTLQPEVLQRLEASRERACELAGRHEIRRFRGAGSLTLADWVRHHRSSVAGTMLVLVLALATVVWEYAGSGNDDDTAAVDASLLAGELPVNAYLDAHLNKWANAN